MENLLESQIAKNLANERWRLSNLYYIKDKSGNKVLFKPNWAQAQLYDDMWYLNIILKARQLGMTTFIQIFMLDRCLFNKNINSGVIAHNQDDARKFFKDKIKFAYDNIPQQIKNLVKATNDSAGELAFSNGSSIRVGTSLRSGTYQYLHVSEFGKLCAKFPDRANEVITGALNTVAKGQFIFIESTAEGAYGSFFEMCKDSEESLKVGRKLTKMDYKFWFFPWYEHPDYVLDEEVEIPTSTLTYFDELKKYGIDLDVNQRRWYSKKLSEQKGKMKQEYPTTPDEAFEQVSEYAVYGEQVGDVVATNRLISLPVNETKPVDVFFDIGKSMKAETTCVWFMQYDDPWFNFIDYYQDSLKTVGAYVSNIKSKGYRIGKWYIPHDAKTQRDYEIKTFEDRLIESGVDSKDIIVVPRVLELKIGIDQAKEVFPACRFDKEKTKKGWLALCSYKYDWDERRAIIGPPIHNWASHPSDSFRQFAQGYAKPNRAKRSKNRRVKINVA